MRVTFTPNGFIMRAMYMAVTSPSVLGLVHRITSCTSSGSMRANSSFIFSCSGPTPSSGFIAPSSTW